MKPYAYKIQKSRFYHISYLTYTFDFLTVSFLEKPPKKSITKEEYKTL